MMVSILMVVSMYVLVIVILSVVMMRFVLKQLPVKWDVMILL